MLLVMLLAMLTITCRTTYVNAIEQAAYEVEKYDYEAVVNKQHSYDVIEKISVNLLDDISELKFSIPGGNYLMTGLKVDNANYTTDKNTNQQTVSIVDADKLTKGHHTYTISYKIQEFADRDRDKDMLYFDVLHPGWMQPITSANIRVSLPSDFPWDDIQYYAGQFGVQNVATKIDFNADEATRTVTIKADRLPENFGITLKSTLPNGYWKGALDGTWATRLALIFAAAVILVLLLLWMIGGRDPRIAKVKQVHPIEGVTPVEMGYIFIEKVRMRDITALLVYLAIRGYLKISEYAPKKYKLIRKEDPTGEVKFIRSAYDTLFEEVPQDRWVDMDELIPRLRKIRNSIEEDVAAGFSSPDMMACTPLSKTFRIIGIVLLSLMIGATCLMRYLYMYVTPNYLEAIGCAAVAAVFLVLICRQTDKNNYAERNEYTLRIILLIIGFLAVPTYIAVRTVLLIGQWEITIAIGGLTILGTVLVMLMRARAKGNAELASRFMQLRHFISHPTAKDIAENAFEDINYYYELVPYALLFNGLESWAITFTALNVPDPEWYSDDIEGNAISNLRTDTATTVDYARDIKAFARTIENLATPRRKK